MNRARWVGGSGSVLCFIVELVNMILYLILCPGTVPVTYMILCPGTVVLPVTYSTADGMT